MVQHPATEQVIVIGAGLGGLTAAALLAKAGHPVTVLEAHTLPGGCASSYYHRGYWFDSGATLVGGFQPGGPHARLGEALGLTWPVRPHNPAMQVWIGDTAITRWGDPERWIAEVAHHFPAAGRFWQVQAEAADRIWRFAARAPAWPPGDVEDVVQLAGSLRPELAPLAPLAWRSAAGWAHGLGARGGLHDRFLDGQLLISAQAIARQTNALYAAIALDLARAGTYGVEGGIIGLARTLVDRLRALGGTVLFRQEVTAIGTDGGAAAWVETTRGLHLEARAIVANVTPADLARLLGAAAGPALHRRERRQASGWGAFLLSLGVDEAAIPAGMPDHQQIIADPSQPLGEGNSIFISVSPAWDPARAPAGRRCVNISTHTRRARWWAALGTPTYEDLKALYTERLLNAARVALPELAGAIRLCLPGTPVTFQRFARRQGGWVGGFPQRSLFSAGSPATGLANVWLVGDSVFPGQSTAGVTAGAERVARTVARHLRRPLARHWPMPARPAAASR